MTEYIYRGFNVFYNIVPTDPEKKLYKADGTLVYLLDPKSFVPVKFHTEDETYAGAEQEIKRMLENYVDFEFKSFYEMKKEKT